MPPPIAMRLDRYAWSEKMGVFGRLRLDTGLDLFTVEKPWLNNQPRISCVPEGVYVVQRRRFNRGGYEALEVMDVPGRTHILFHIGNTADDLLGCIAPGVGEGWVNHKWAVVNSTLAFNNLMAEFQHLQMRDAPVAVLTIGGRNSV